MSKKFIFIGVFFSVFLSSCNNFSSTSKKKLTSATTSEPSGGGVGGAGPAVKDLDVSWSPQWSALVGYWPLNRTLDSSISGGDNIPTIIGTNGVAVVGSSMNYVAGQVNKGASFNGSEGIEVSTTVGVSASLFTATAWFKTTSHGDIKILCQNSSASCLIQTFGGNVRICINGCAVSSTFVADGSWHFAATVGDGTSTRLYLDGHSNPEFTLGASGKNFTTNFSIGNYSNSNYFTGFIDDVAIYNQALKPEEINAIYNHQN